MKKFFYTLGLACVLSLASCTSTDKKGGDSDSNKTPEATKTDADSKDDSSTASEIDSKLDRLQNIKDEMSKYLTSENVDENQLSNLQNEAIEIMSQLSTVEGEFTPAQQQRLEKIMAD